MARIRMGRTRNFAVKREPNGQRQRERHEICPKVLAYRARDLIRDGVSAEHSRDALAAFTLGRLLLRWRANKDDPGGISQKQYDAGEKWAKIVRQHASLMGYKLTIGSPGFHMVAGGNDTAPEPDDQLIARTRGNWRDCYSALMETCRDHGMRVRDVTYGVCVDNWPIGSLTAADYGWLRYGLNTLSRVLGT